MQEATFLILTALAAGSQHVWVGFHTLALFYDVGHVSASSAAVWTVIASVVFWLVEVSAVVLILSKLSGPYFRHRPGVSGATTE